MLFKVNECKFHFLFFYYFFKLGVYELFFLNIFRNNQKKKISKNSNQYDREVFTMILIFIFSKIYNNSIVNSKTIES